MLKPLEVNRKRPIAIDMQKQCSHICHALKMIMISENCIVYRIRRCSSIYLSDPQCCWLISKENGNKRNHTQIQNRMYLHLEPIECHTSMHTATIIPMCYDRLGVESTVGIVVVSHLSISQSLQHGVVAFVSISCERVSHEWLHCIGTNGILFVVPFFALIIALTAYINPRLNEHFAISKPLDRQIILLFIYSVDRYNLTCRTAAPMTMILLAAANTTHTHTMSDIDKWL